MSKVVRRLGRGLDSLVPNLRSTTLSVEAKPALATTEPSQEASLPDGDAGRPATQATTIPVEQIDPNPFQPRDSIADESILSLSESIRRTGILQPLSVRRKEGRFQIIAGERRWRAAQAAGLREVPVVVRDAGDDQMLEWALVENIQREDLNAIDRAKAYRELSNRCGLKPEELGGRLGEDRTTVANYLRLLDLPAAIQQMVAGGHLSMGHARSLLSVADEADRLRLAESVARNELSVRALEEIVRREKTRAGSGGAAPRQERKTVHILNLQQRFEEALKTKVAIHEGKRKGTGRIVIEYFSLDDFDRVADALGVQLD